MNVPKVVLMPKVLMICYFFPPLGSVQVLRAVKFAKYLPHYGWEPVILGVKDVLHYYQDSDILQEISPDLHIYRTESFDPFRLWCRIKKTKPHTSQKTANQKFQWIRDNLNGLNRWFSLPDSRFGWYPFAVKEGLRIIKNENIDVIYSSSPPNTCHLVARELHRKTGIPWISDFKDLWTDYPHLHPTPLHRNIMRNWEKKILNESNQVITVNSGITDYFLKQYPQFTEKIDTLVHGVDPDEYVDISPNFSPQFTIIHTGSFFEPRQIPDYFLKALKDWLVENPSLENQINVVFAGSLNSRHHELIIKLGLTSIIQERKSLPRKEAIQLQCKADLLLLLVGKGKGSQHVVPAKTWEYLASGRPILCMAPEGVTRDLVNKYESGWIADPDDCQAIKRILDDAFNQFKREHRHELKIRLNNEYNRKYVTGVLADKMSKLIKKNPST